MFGMNKLDQICNKIKLSDISHFDGIFYAGELETVDISEEHIRVDVQITKKLNGNLDTKVKLKDEAKFNSIIEAIEINHKADPKSIIGFTKKGTGKESQFHQFKNDGYQKLISVSQMVCWLGLANEGFPSNYVKGRGPGEALGFLWIIFDENPLSYRDVMEHWISFNQQAGSPLMANVNISNLLESQRNLILEGVPGTGKTFVFKDIVKRWDECFPDIETKPKFIEGEAITLHPAVTYEDFMEGLRPVGNKKDLGDYRKCSESASKICLKVKDNEPTKEDLSEKWFHVKPDNEPSGNSLDFDYKYGFFLRICCKAVNNPLNHYLVLLDEINRCNIPKVFGDLITTIENSKRGIWVKSPKPSVPEASGDPPNPNQSVPGASGDESDKGCWDLTNSQVVALPGSGRLFFVPGNIYIVATMNTSDRSVAPLDAALRRRFAFHRIQPKGFDNNLELKYVKNSSDSCEKIAKDILNEFPPDFCDVVEKWCEINYLLKDKLGEDAMLGHSYLYDLAKKLKEAASINGNLVEHFWNHDVLPDLSEIFNSNNYNKKDIEGFFSLNVTLKDHFTVTELAVGSNRSSRIVYKQDEKKVSDKIANSANTSE